MYNWLSGPGALTKTPLPHGARPAFSGVSKGFVNQPQKWNPFPRPSWYFLVSLGGDVFPEVIQKEYQNDVEKGCTRRLKTGPLPKCGKCEFDMRFAMFWPCGAPLNKYLSGVIWGIRVGSKHRF